MFRGEVALVTGAASGVGQLSAWRLAAGGAQVVALDIDEAGLARTARHAPMIHTMPCDVAVTADVDGVVRRVEHDLGPIDRVVNAAAVVDPASLLDGGVEAVRRATSVNYLGLVHVTMAVVPAMVQRRSGDVVQFASVAGWTPAPHLGAYSATQAAVVSFSESLHREIEGSGVRLCCVCPPLVGTPQFDKAGLPAAAPAPPRRLKVAGPEEVLDAAEVALERRRLFAFPGRGAGFAWRLHRVAPGLVERMGVLG